jgi:hypothetical protein
MPVCMPNLIGTFATFREAAQFARELAAKHSISLSVRQESDGWAVASDQLLGLKDKEIATLTQQVEALQNQLTTTKEEKEFFRCRVIRHEATPPKEVAEIAIPSSRRRMPPLCHACGFALNFCICGN